MVHTRVGVGIVVISAGRVLLAERRGEQPPLLALPGGKLEGGESVEECAARELREETGLELEGAETFGCVLVDDWVVAGVRGHHSGATAPAEREPDKVGGFVWADPAQLPANLYPASAALLELL